MSPDDARHGTEAGHEQHHRDGEDPCAACSRAKLIASRRRSKRRQMGYSYTIPADTARARLARWRDGGATYGEIADHTGIEESRVWEILNDPTGRIYTRTHNAIMRAKGWPVTALGITRRVQALCRLGYSMPTIAAACGVSHDTIADLRARTPVFVSRKVRAGVIAGYAELEMKTPAQEGDYQRRSVTRCRAHAERMGWPSPMAFDDIDDPNEQPQGVRTPARRDLLAEWHDLRDAGESIEQAAVRLGVTVGAIERAEFRKKAAA